METTLQTLNQLPCTKDEQETFVEYAVSEIINGNHSFKELLVNKKIWVDTIEKIFSDQKVKEFLQDEFEKEGVKKVGFRDAEIEMCSRRTFDYSLCDDQELKRLESKYNFHQEGIKPVEEKIKDRKEFLKTLKKPIEIIDETTGEVYKIFPAAAKHSTFFKIKY